MKRLKIRNFGPIKDASIELRRVNVVIGPQSSGKSCVLKIASYCTWVEKRIELAQSQEEFEHEDMFFVRLLTFHRLHGYVEAVDNAYIEYESDFMVFSYDHFLKKFDFQWKSGRWDYRRPKVSYIPSERNLVAAIPNWYEVKFQDDNVKNFMADWETARKMTTNLLDVLNLGVSYRYDPNDRSDNVVVAGGKSLDFSTTSSGLQSLIPLWVHLNYLYDIQFGAERSESVAMDTNIKSLSNAILSEYMTDVKLKEGGTVATRHMYNMFFFLPSEEKAEEFERIISHFIEVDHNEIFLEEPEDNLFPPTQAALVEWLLKQTFCERKNRLFIATHSPYVVTSFLEKQDLTDFNLFFTMTSHDGTAIKTATPDELQEIYDNGLDVFFNLEAFR